MAERFFVKSDVEDDEGALTAQGMRVATEYARAWLAGQRSLELEGQHPDLEGLFYDLRIDPALARRYAVEDDPVAKSLEEELEKAFLDDPATAYHITIGADGTIYKAGVGAHKYLRRFKGPGGKWVYVYADDVQSNRKGRGASTKAEAMKVAKKDKRAHKEPVKHEGVTETAPKPWYPAGTPLKRLWVDRIPGEPMGISNPAGDDGGTFAKYGGDLRTGQVTDPERRKLHARIVDAALNKPSVPPGEQKYAVVMMGGPASGKSTATRGMGLEEFVHVDPDAVKDELPEMQKGLNLGRAGDGTIVTAKSTAAAVHEESSQIATNIRKRAIAEHKHVLVDGTGKNADKHAKLIQHLQSKGYRVHLVMAHQTAENAHQLNKGRATTSGRFVPEAVVDDAYSKIPHNFQTLARMADEATMFDASRGHPPKKVWTLEKGPPPAEGHHDREFVSGFQRQFRGGE